MAHKHSTDRFSLHNINAVSWMLTMGLALSLILNAGSQPRRAFAQSKSTKQSANTQSRNESDFERKGKEGEALRAQGTPESLRLAVKKYEEALLPCRASGETTPTLVFAAPDYKRYQ